MLVFIFSIISIIFLGTWMYLERRNHKKKIQGLKVIVHVNGIRGKSSVTRLIAGVLRAGGYNTVGKVTGNAPNVINQKGEDVPIIRKGPANIIEQVKVVREHVDNDVDAIVFECMAIKPKLQKFLQEHIIEANVGIITNIREDHMEEMGYSLEEIAESLSSTLPKKGGYCITSEDNPKLREILKEKCDKKGTDFYNALNYKVSDELMCKFPYQEHKSNVQLGLALADILGIPKHKALLEMLATKKEKEVLTIKKYRSGNKILIWANMFSINDTPSCILNIKNILDEYENEDVAKACILNNRKDRPDRSIQFLDLISSELEFDLNIAFGAFEKQVTKSLKEVQRKTYAPGNLVIDNPEGFINEIFSKTKKDKVILFGLANIHTPQAHALIEFLDNLK